MKNLRLLLLASCMLFLMCGCNDFWYDLSSDFIEASFYDAKIGNRSLGHVEDMLTNIYAIEGLSENEYLGITRGSLWGNGNKSNRASLIMNKNVQEPIFRYDIYEVKIERDKVNFDGSITTVGNPIVIKDSGIIANLISLHAEGNGKREDDFKTDPESNYYNSVSFYFDLPCELIWNSSIFRDKDEDGNHIIYWRCYNVAENREICYVVTEILLPLLS